MGGNYKTQIYVIVAVVEQTLFQLNYSIGFRTCNRVDTSNSNKSSCNKEQEIKNILG